MIIIKTANKEYIRGLLKYESSFYYASSEVQILLSCKLLHIIRKTSLAYNDPGNIYPFTEIYGTALNPPRICFTLQLFIVPYISPIFRLSSMFNYFLIVYEHYLLWYQSWSHSLSNLSIYSNHKWGCFSYKVYCLKDSLTISAPTFGFQLSRSKAQNLLPNRHWAGSQLGH